VNIPSERTRDSSPWTLRAGGTPVDDGDATRVCGHDADAPQLDQDKKGKGGLSHQKMEPYAALGFDSS